MRAGVHRKRVVEHRPNTVFVGNIPYGVTEQQIYKLFHRFGKITKHQYLWHRKGERRGVPKGFCFVEYEKRESSTRARLAMNGRMLCGRKIVVSNAQRKVQITDKNGNKRGDVPDERKSNEASDVSNDDKIRAIQRKLANMERSSSAKSRVHKAVAEQSVSLAPETFALTPAASASSSSSSSSSKKRKRQKGADNDDEESVDTANEILRNRARTVSAAAEAMGASSKTEESTAALSVSSTLIRDSAKCNGNGSNSESSTCQSSQTKTTDNEQSRAGAENSTNQASPTSSHSSTDLSRPTENSSPPSNKRRKTEAEPEIGDQCDFSSSSSRTISGDVHEYDSSSSGTRPATDLSASSSSKATKCVHFDDSLNR